MMNQPGEETGDGVPEKRRRGRPKKIQQQSLSSTKRTSSREEAPKAPSRKNPGPASGSRRGSQDDLSGGSQGADTSGEVSQVSGVSQAGVNIKHNLSKFLVF